MTREKTIRILLVEDNPADARFVERLLAKASPTAFEMEWADRVSTGLERIAAGGFDIVLLDLSLPDSPDAAETFRRVTARAPDLPVVVMTGQEDQELALTAVREGAQDYLVKRQVESDLLARSLRYAIERKRAEEALRESEERYALAVSGAADGVWDWKIDTGEAYFSPRWKALLGYADEEIGGDVEEWFRRVLPEDLPGLKDALKRHLEGREPHFEHEHRIQAKDGTVFWVLSRGMAVRDAAGRPYRMAGSLTDIHERKRSEEQLLHDAFHDALTGLANRVLFIDRLGLALEQSRRRGGEFAVLFFDLDRFKNINDSLGHSVGDDLLIELADRLRRFVRPGDTVARLGGDEFAVILADIEKPLDATMVAERLQEVLRDRFSIGEGQVVTSASIGIALSSPGYERPEDMLRDADIAMYRAKAAGRACYQVFDETMHRSAVALLKMEMDLRRALEHDHFVMFYQPIVSLDSGRIVGFEGLVRWQHPERGLIPPDRFIAVAEETGLIVPLGWWVLTEVCRQGSEWQRRYRLEPPLYVSVNISGKIVMQPDMVDRVIGILEQARLPPESLKLEITESVIMDHGEEALTRLSELRALGVRFSIDDFGTGYSSLSYLQEFSYDTLKIDRSFIEAMGRKEGNAAIIQTIVALAGMLHMDVVAEGVETPDQLDRLRQIGCQQAQGFWFSRPVDRHEAESLIQAGSLGLQPPS